MSTRQSLPLIGRVCCTIALAAGLSAVVAEAGTITGVTIQDVSSSFSARTADRTVDGSGLTGGLHTNLPDADGGTMWLTDIDLPSNDPWITYDLGANYNLGSFQVWNYNEYSPARRGVQQVEIFTAGSAASPAWVSRGTFSLAMAPGSSDYAGQYVAFPYDDVRLVKFDVASNWNGHTYPATGQPDYNAVTGLSEVRFQTSVPFLVDTFDNQATAVSYSGSDYGLNQELSGRQLGADSPVSYVRVAGAVERFQVNRTDTLMPAPGKLILFSDGGTPRVTGALANNFLSNVALAVTVDPVVGDTQSDDWLAFTLRGQGVAPDNADLSFATNAGALFAIRSSGGWFVSQNGGQDYLASSANLAPNADGSFDLALSVMGDQFSATVNGTLLDLNGTSPGASLNLTGLAAGVSNFIAFGSSFGTDGYGLQNGYKGFSIDNLAVVPEPASILLMGTGLLGMLGLLACRRRRRARK